MADKYILRDRTLLTNYAIQITNGELSIASDAGAFQSEPVLKDLASTDRWRIFITNEQLGFELVPGSNLSDEIVLDDTVTGDRTRLEIEDGQVVITPITVLEVEAEGGRKHYVNDIGTIFLIDTGTDVSDYESLEVRLMKPDGTESVKAATLNGTDELKYIVENGDFDQAGLYQMQARVVSGAGRWRGETTEFYVYEEFE